MIYICIPAYNEAATIGVLLWKIRRVMSEFPRDYEMLVLDDASTDETRDVLPPYSRTLPLTVLRNDRRLGYAASLERLLREAVARATHPRRDMIITLQADFTEAPEDIPALVRRMEGGADLVEGIVNRRGPRTPRVLRWADRSLPWLLGRIRLPEGIRDPLSGFRAYRVAVLKKTLADRNGSPLIAADGWAANVQLVTAIAPHIRRIDGVEVEARYDRRQRGSRFKPWRTLVQLWGVARASRGAEQPSADRELAA